MELSIKQLQEVEKYLHNKNFDFIDLKVEVLDHITSDIEVKMIAGDTFTEAFKSVTQKWSSQFKDSESYYFGLGFSAPKIIIDKAKKTYKKFYILLFASYFVPFVLLTELGFIIKNPSESILLLILQLASVFCLGFFLWMFFNRENRIKTTFSFILKSQSLSVLVGLIISIIFLCKPKEINGIHMGMLSTFIFSTYSYFHFHKKHKEAILKYKIC